ncbi:MAG: IPT/TIG domain-containing protein [Deltaproteobacteria bacterium]|nr:IPT/TIG domain-containing protein [Deltaproteobacteria bacterium]
MKTPTYLRPILGLLMAGALAVSFTDCSCSDDDAETATSSTTDTTPTADLTLDTALTTTSIEESEALQIAATLNPHVRESALTQKRASLSKVAHLEAADVTCEAFIDDPNTTEDDSTATEPIAVEVLNVTTDPDTGHVKVGVVNPEGVDLTSENVTLHVEFNGDVIGTENGEDLEVTVNPATDLKNDDTGALDGVVPCDFYTTAAAKLEIAVLKNGVPPSQISRGDIFQMVIDGNLQSLDSDAVEAMREPLAAKFQAFAQQVTADPSAIRKASDAAMKSFFKAVVGQGTLRSEAAKGIAKGMAATFSDLGVFTADQYKEAAAIGDKSFDAQLLVTKGGFSGDVSAFERASAIARTNRDIGIQYYSALQGVGDQLQALADSFAKLDAMYATTKTMFNTILDPTTLIDSFGMSTGAFKVAFSDVMSTISQTVVGVPPGVCKNLSKSDGEAALSYTAAQLIEKVGASITDANQQAMWSNACREEMRWQGEVTNFEAKGVKVDPTTRTFTDFSAAGQAVGHTWTGEIMMGGALVAGKSVKEWTGANSMEDLRKSMSDSSVNAYSTTVKTQIATYMPAFTKSSFDEDGDGLPSAYELFAGFNPLSATTDYKSAMTTAQNQITSGAMDIANFYGFTYGAGVGVTDSSSDVNVKVCIICAGTGNCDSSKLDGANLMISGKVFRNVWFDKGLMGTTAINSGTCTPVSLPPDSSGSYQFAATGAGSSYADYLTAPGGSTIAKITAATTVTVIMTGLTVAATGTAVIADTRFTTFSNSYAGAGSTATQIFADVEDSAAAASLQPGGSAKLKIWGITSSDTVSKLAFQGSGGIELQATCGAGSSVEPREFTCTIPCETSNSGSIAVFVNGTAYYLPPKMFSAKASTCTSTTIAMTTTMVTALPMPSISNIPTTNVPPGGPFTITGLNFGSGGTVQLVKDAVATNQVTTSWSSTSIAVTVNNNTVQGAYTVRVNVTGGSSANSTVTVNVGAPAPPAPTITGFTPTSGLPGVAVTIMGSNFGATQGSSLLQLVVGTEALGVTPTTWSATSIGFQIPGPPAFVAGIYPVKVVVGGVAATAPTNLTINAAPPPSGLTIEARNGAGNAFGNGATITKNTASPPGNNGTAVNITATVGTFGSDFNLVQVKIFSFTAADCTGPFNKLGSGGPAGGLPYNTQQFTSTVVPIIIEGSGVTYTGPFKFAVAVNNGTAVTSQCLNLQ